MTPSDATILALSNNFTVTALALLAQCLERQGSIASGDYARAIRATIEADGADRGRLDYQLLSGLLRQLEGVESPVN